MSNQEIYPIGGAWPLGTFTVTSGTPVPIFVQPDGFTWRSKPGCRMLTVQAPAANTGDIYVMLGNYPSTDANHVLAIVAKGEIISLPYGGALTESRLNLANIYIDGGTSDDTCIVVAYDAA